MTGESCRSELLKAVHDWVANNEPYHTTPPSWATIVADYIWPSVATVLFCLTFLVRWYSSHNMVIIRIDFFVQVFAGFLLEQVLTELLSKFFDKCLWAEVSGLVISTLIWFAAENILWKMEAKYPHPRKLCCRKSEESKTSTSDGCQIFRVFKQFKKVETVDLDEKVEKI